MKYGMNSEQFRILEQLVIQPLKNLGCEVFIFGSRTTNRHHPYSDVDILFRLPPGKVLPALAIANIKEEIEESSFPFLVDLVYENDLVESYRENVFRSLKQL